MDIPALYDLAAQLGAGAALLLVIGIVALTREWVVPGAAYRRHVEECSEHIDRLERRVNVLEGFADEALRLGEEGASLLPKARTRRP